VFVGTNVHIGTDEYSNKDKKVVEQFRAFTDHYLRLVQSFGKQPWLWGALTHAKGNTPVVSENVIMQCWYPRYANPTAMKEQGYKLVCIPSWSTYIVPAAGYYADYLNVNNLYNKWHPGTFNASILDPKDPCLLGGMFAVWNDITYNGISVDDIHDRTIPATQTMAAATWSYSYRTVPFKEFDTKRNILSEAPGVNELGRFDGEPKSVVYSLPEVKPGKEYPVKKAGFHHTISFHLDGAKEEPGTLLFSNDVTKFFLSSPVDGRMAFQRDGYLYAFDYYVEEGKSHDIRIECTNHLTRLFVNGKLRDELKRVKRYIRDKEQHDYVQTLHFPLQQAGKFKSIITDLKVENYVR
jgi:hexosaminidase